MKRKFLLSVILTLTAISSVFAQQNLTLYNMEFIPQRLYANPSFIHSNKVYIGLPMISSQYFSVSNSGFKYSDLVTHVGDSLALDYDNMLSKLSENNYLSTAIQPDLLSFGFRVKKNYISFNATAKTGFSFRYPKNFMELIWKGNGGLLGEEVNLNFGVNAFAYAEYGLGFAREINDKLTVGVKVKYLSGIANLWTEKTDISLTTDPNTYAITAKSDIKVNATYDTAMFNNVNVGNILFSKNKGWGLDLGGNYKVSEKFHLSASVVDLGFINWKQGVSNYQSKNPGGSFTFEGLDLNQIINDDDTTSNVGDVIADTLTKTFQIDTAHNAYKTKLSTKIYIGGNYYLTEKINLGALLYGQFFDSKLHPGFTLSYNQRVGRWLNFSLSYSGYNRSYNNIGAGIALGNGPLQLYVVSDNVLGAIFPQNTKNIHLNFGINLTFGKTRDKDKDGVSDKKDDCIDVAGLKDLKGCPDKDGDKVADKDDACPEVSGLADLKGCPDKDGDKVADKDDACPEEAGLANLQGCPDKDVDGIADKDDACPEVAGLADLKGCPDKDGDKIADKDDACPEVAGLATLQGCPDKDGDGIADKDDACPEKAGVASNKGCPEIKLDLIDPATGNVLKSAAKKADGSYAFDGEAYNENQVFRLNGEPQDSLKELNIIIGGAYRKAQRIDANYPYKYNFPKTAKTEDVALILDEKEAEVLKKAFDNLEFATGKDIIKETSYESLNTLAGLMTDKPNWRLKISGHTDNKGNANANMQLSKKRAEAVKKYLVKKGISDKRFKVEWFGPNKPIADNSTEEGRQKNRRVEMLIIE